MAEVIRMPKMSDTMTEGVIAAWHKQVGDAVKSGELLAEIETDKATMDFESPASGILLYIGPNAKEAVAIDGILAIIGKAGEAFEALLGGSPQVLAQPVASTPGTPQPPAAQNKENAVAVSTLPPPPKTAEKVNANAILMPKMTDTMTEGVLVKWHKKVGDAVKSGDLLAEIETDKATMDFESPESGTLLYLGVEAGKPIQPGTILAIVGQAGANYQALLQSQSQTSNGTAFQPVSTPPADALAPQANGTSLRHDEHIKASPLAKVLAKEKGIDIAQIPGSGPEGRIIKKDVENYVPMSQPAKEMPATLIENKPSEKPAATGDFEEVSLSQMRKTIARRLSESMFSAPHFYLTMEINMDKMVEYREQINQVSPVKISFNDLVIKAAALALRKHPAINASWLGDKIRYHHSIHIGMAVAVAEGLLVPVIRNTDHKLLSEIANQTKELAGKAKDKKLQPAEMEGSTFSISNLGMFGIEEFTAIINPPNSCILAVGTIKQAPIVKEGEIKVGNLMKLTLSCDHRVVDGATGADFMKTLKGILEEPLRLTV
jgi:pyruvate dehydrogenase E2 component (dihydrolipoamide acetyltransferase)